jgi:hypothetical protein
MSLTWANIANLGVTAKFIATSATGQYVIIVAPVDDLYISSDYGATFLPQTISGLNGGCCSISATGQYIVLAGSNTIFYSANFGTSFSDITGGLISSFAGCAIHPNNDYILIGDNATGEVHKTTNQGASWSSVVVDPPNSIYRMSAKTPSSVCISNGVNFLATSTNGFTTFSVKNPGASTLYADCDTSQTGTYLVTITSTNIYISNNSGTSWTPINPTPQDWNSCSMSNSGGIVLVSGKGDKGSGGGPLYVSLNNGITWATTESIRTWADCAVSGDGQYLYSVTNAGNLYRTTVGPSTDVAVTVTVVGTGTVTSTPAGINQVNAGTSSFVFDSATYPSITLTATGPNPVVWSGDLSGTASSQTLPLDASTKSVTATFTETPIPVGAPPSVAYVPSQSERADQFHLLQCPTGSAGPTDYATRTREIRAQLSGCCPASEDACPWQYTEVLKYRGPIECANSSGGFQNTGAKYIGPVGCLTDVGGFQNTGAKYVGPVGCESIGGDPSRTYVASQSERADQLNQLLCPCDAPDGPVFTSYATRLRAIRSNASGCCPEFSVTGITVTGGSSYAVGNFLQLSGGRPVDKPLLVRVVTIGGGGSIATVEIVYPGNYYQKPTGVSTMTRLTGAGTGSLSVTVTWSDEECPCPWRYTRAT